MPLLDLPLEMSQRIADLAISTDLFAPRLVCREAAAKVKRTFIAIHMGERRIAIEGNLPRDVARTVATANHSDFGPALKLLKVAFDPPNYYEDEAVDSYQELDQKKSLIIPHLLFILFDTLRARGHRISPFLGSYQGDTIDNPDVNSEETYEYTEFLKALANSGLKIESLESPRGWFLPMHIDDAGDNHLSLWPMVLSKLETLKMNTDCEDKCGDEGVEAARLLGELPELRQLG